MRELLAAVDRLLAAGEKVALARVVGVVGSGPLEPGSALAVSESGEVAGSLAAGCIESAVVATALEVLRTGRPVVEEYGYTDDDAFAVGLSCGGRLRVLVEPIDETW